MPFIAIIDPELKKTLYKLATKDKTLTEAIFKKIEQICSCDNELIDHYKNLRSGLSDFKRVHINKSFVLLFHVNKKEDRVYFSRIAHHDDAYK